MTRRRISRERGTLIEWSRYAIRLADTIGHEGQVDQDALFTLAVRQLEAVTRRLKRWKRQRQRVPLD